MTYPRAHLIDAENGGYYHLTSRCVRRAFLCGVDKETTRNFDHRRQWIEDRIIELGNIFAVAVYGYAVMSNHYHLVVKVDPHATQRWSDDLVVDKWLHLYGGRADSRSKRDLLEMRRESLLEDHERLAIIRDRLGSLSWLMRFINEPLARIANSEDRCTGRFWEGRFKSQAILDDASLLACMAYVDLNPIRAGAAHTLEESTHTSVRARIKHHSKEDALLPMTGGISAAHEFPILLKHYLSLVENTAFAQRHFRRGLASDLDRILNTCGLNFNAFHHTYLAQHSHWRRALGSIEALAKYLEKCGLGQLRMAKKHKPPLRLIHVRV